MKSLLKFSLFVLCASFLLSSCGKKGDSGKMIPANALFVAQLNMKSLTNKVSMEDLKKMAWYQKEMADTSHPEWMKKLLENPENSGIDLDDALVFFVNKDKNQNYQIVLEGSVKKAIDFEAFNKNFSHGNAPTKSGNLNILALKNNNISAWNDKNFVYVMVIPQSPKYTEYDDTLSTPSATSPEDNSAALTAFATNLFNLKTDSSLANNTKYSDLVNQKGDIYMWQNMEEIMNNNAALGMLGMMKLDVFFKGNLATYRVSFDDGKIAVDQRNYVSKELGDFYKKYNGTKINTEMIKNIPSQNVIGMFAANFKPAAIEELIKLIGADGIANMFLQQAGFNLQDITKANNGNLLVAITDLNMKNDTSLTQQGMTMNRSMMPEMNMLFAMGVNDKPSFQKIMNYLDKFKNSMSADTFVNAQLTDKYFVVSNHTTFANGFLSGKSKSTFDFLDKIDNHPFGAYLDFQKLLSIISTNIKTDSFEKKALDASLKTWKNATFKGGDFEDGAIKSNIEVNMVDEKTNSLKQLALFADEMYKINKEREASLPKMANMDSLLTPPPVDTIPIDTTVAK
ncbi:MAG: DUF4836 family protein [Bacteroidetes bacterium]|nr:DUF4836 family protein [Bacteroidota bacterium]